MKHLGTKELETERLLLRRFTINDADNMYKNWASDPEVTKYLMWPTHDSVHIKRYFKYLISNYEKRIFISGNCAKGFKSTNRNN